MCAAGAFCAQNPPPAHIVRVARERERLPAPVEHHIPLPMEGQRHSRAVGGRLGARGRGYGLVPGIPKSPVVPGAILFDMANGGDKGWGEAPPYRELGRQAVVARRASRPG